MSLERYDIHDQADIVAETFWPEDIPLKPETVSTLDVCLRRLARQGQPVMGSRQAIRKAIDSHHGYFNEGLLSSDDRCIVRLSASDIFALCSYLQLGIQVLQEKLFTWPYETAKPDREIEEAHVYQKLYLDASVDLSSNLEVYIK